MRRIVFLITMGIERPSGQRYFNIARELVQSGSKVRILALHPDLQSCNVRRFVQDGVEIWYVGQMHSHKRDGETLPMKPVKLLRVLCSATLGMIWGIICSPSDIYHLGKPQPINGVAALLGVCGLRWRRFWVDCDDDEVTSNRFSSRWQQQVFAFWQWLLPALAAGVTVNTHFLAQRMRRRGIEPVVYVPNGVDFKHFQPPDGRMLAKLRTSLGLDGKQIIAYVGTVAFHNHPVDMLLEAFRLYSATNPNAVLLIIGGGEDLPTVKNWVQQYALIGRVICLGNVPRQTLPLYMSLATITVDPVYDNDVARARSPLKIVESLALGIPVITSNVGDRAAVIGRSGMLVKAGDVHELCLSMSSVLCSYNQNDIIMNNKKYSWQQITSEFNSIYGDVL